MGAALTFMEGYDRHGDSLLDGIITGDETWMRHVNCETKLHSMQWGHTSSPKRPRKCLQTLSPKKIMATVFWDRQGVLLIDLFERGAPQNSQRYCQTLRNLRRAFQNKRRGKLTSKVLFLQDNVRPHTANCTQKHLNSFKWEVFRHAPYSPDLALSYFHLFPKLKNWLSTQCFDDDKELRVRVTE
ncbi:mariner Mos1 transposase [Trichonephila clavipes]|nr:mariner Mos1 transposase [Trichonephila clavipes]